jgi:peptidoglycan hydrolase-like protein with peptidoglycan-binding domain
MMLQRQMRLLGVYNGPVDGTYGKATQAAIAAFQTSAGLPASGTLDQATWQRMSTPQLLGQTKPGRATPPELFPNAGVSEAEAEASKPVAQDNPEPSPTASPEHQPDVGEGAKTKGNSPLTWLLPGALVVGGGLMVATLLYRMRSSKMQRSYPESSFPVLDSAPQPEPSVADTAILTSRSNRVDSPPGDALAEWPPSATTRLSVGDIVDSLVNDLASLDGAVRRHAIWELGQQGHSAAIQPLVNGLLEADSQEKSLILAALAEISSRSLKPMHRALALGLQDPSPEVRKNAIRDLSRVYDTVVQLSHMLAHATQDPDPGVQETAQWALSQLNRIPAAPYPSALPPEVSYDGDRLPPA